MWVPGAYGCGQSVERTQKEGCQAGCQREYCCSQLLPAGSQAFGERPSQRLVQKFAQVQQIKNRGELEPQGLTHSIALLSCYTVVILLGCKDRVGAEEVGFQFVWRSLVRFSQGWCWGNKWLRHTLYRNYFDLQKKPPASEMYFPNSFCLPKINPWGPTYISYIPYIYPKLNTACIKPLLVWYAGCREQAEWEWPKVKHKFYLYSFKWSS